MSTPLWKQAYGEERAADYERLLREGMGPTYAALLEATVDAVAAHVERPRHVLDLGAGTGNVSVALRKRFPQAALVALDGSSAMLSVAQKRLLDAAFVHRAFGARGWTKDLGTYDAVTSAGAVHHLEARGKQRLFRDIFALLRPGGVLVLADPVAGETRAQARLYEDAWVNVIARNLAKAGKAVGVEDIRREHRRVQKAEGDVPSPLRHQLRWLSEAGFTRVDCWWKSFGFAVFGGVRPAGR